MVRLVRIELLDFRNIEFAALDFSPGFNFLHGPNGAGKTAVLEAVHVLGRGRSFRTNQIQDAIRSGRERMVIRATLEDEHVGRQRVVFSRGRESATEIRINGEPCQRTSQVAALLPLEAMTPELVELVFGRPAVRRQWLDWGVFHVKHEFLAIVRRFNTSLRQRNACLKSIGIGRLREADLEPWTIEVARLGEQIDQWRAQHFRGLTVLIEGCLRELGANFELSLSYKRGWGEDRGFLAALNDSIARDLRMGATSVGPHRADVELRSHGQLSANTLSRGQAKVLASALLLAQADHILMSSSRTGLFLVDDIGAELDSEHRGKFFGALLARGVQVLATSVDNPGLSGAAEFGALSTFHVEQGRISADAVE